MSDKPREIIPPRVREGGPIGAELGKLLIDRITTRLSPRFIMDPKTGEVFIDKDRPNEQA